MLYIPSSIKLIGKFLSVHQTCIRNLCFNQRPPYYGNDGFEILLNVKFYRPDEISVKVIENAVIVEGKRVELETRENSITREFLQEYILPVGYDIDKMTSTLSSDGLLQIKAPPQTVLSQTPRIINIQLTEE